MSGVDVLPVPRLSVDVKRELEVVAEQRMLAPARKAGIELRMAGATGLPQHEAIYRNPWGTWLFVDHLDDPAAEEYKGQIPVPEEQIGRLVQLGQCGVRPQLAWLVHQLPDSYQDGDPLPALVPAPRELREKDERLTLRLAQATSLYLKSAFAVLAATASPLAAITVAGLDPIVFGGVKHPRLPIVGWCVLAQWEWE